MSIHVRAELGIRQLRSRFLEYTRKAFELLPVRGKQRILDIGCGRGESMFELAKLSDSQFVGIDIDEEVLAELEKRIELEGLASRISAIQCSLFETDFPDRSFDIIWEEGVLHLLDELSIFPECHRLLKPGGYLVMGETIEWAEAILESISEYGFELVDRLDWEEGCWLTEYYGPLEKRIEQLREKYGKSEDIPGLARYENEVEMVKKYPGNTDCGHFILKKI